MMKVHDNIDEYRDIEIYNMENEIDEYIKMMYRNIYNVAIKLLI